MHRDLRRGLDADAKVVPSVADDADADVVADYDFLELLS
jgi:hypothetical protein